MNNTRPQRWKRVLAHLLTLQMALAPLEPALAQATKLADEPIGYSPSAPPNIVLTVDDSTSMLADFLPDFVISGVPGAAPAVGGFCRDSTGQMTVPCGFIGSPTTPAYTYSAGNTTGGLNVPYPRYAVGTPAYTASTIPDWMRAWPAPVHNNAMNRLYYDPSVTYTPPRYYNDTPYPTQNAGTTLNWTKVVTDPWIAPALSRASTSTSWRTGSCSRPSPGSGAIGTTRTNSQSGWRRSRTGGSAVASQ